MYYKCNGRRARKVDRVSNQPRWEYEGLKSSQPLKVGSRIWCSDYSEIGWINRFFGDYSKMKHLAALKFWSVPHNVMMAVIVMGLFDFELQSKAKIRIYKVRISRDSGYPTLRSPEEFCPRVRAWKFFWWLYGPNRYQITSQTFVANFFTGGPVISLTCICRFYFHGWRSTSLAAMIINHAPVNKHH